MPSSDNSPARSKKKGGGFLNRQVAKTKKSESVTEEQLLQKSEPVTVDDVLMLENATESESYFQWKFIKKTKPCSYIWVDDPNSIQ